MSSSTLVSHYISLCKHTDVNVASPSLVRLCLWIFMMVCVLAVSGIAIEIEKC